MHKPSDSQENYLCTSLKKTQCLKPIRHNISGQLFLLILLVCVWKVKDKSVILMSNVHASEITRQMQRKKRQFLCLELLM